MATRVFQLAKELGVTSKDILDKCRAEGLELKNHMAALSAGLEATIREWFSQAAASHSAVETAEAVDLETARKKAASQRRRRKTKEEEGQGTTVGVAEASPAETAPESSPLTEAPLAEVPEPVAQAEEIVVMAESSAPVTGPVGESAQHMPAGAVESAPAAPEGPDKQAEVGPENASGRPEPTWRVNNPVVPEVKPAGPQLVPKPARLQGPRVVRVESPDRVPQPRRRPPRTPEAQPEAPGRVAAAGDSTQPRVGPVEGADEAHGKKTKRRSPRRRGGRSAASGEGTREWRERDLSERRDRLAAATGGGLRRYRATLSRPMDGRGLLHAGPVEVEEPITLKGLSAAAGIKSVEMMKKLMAQGVMATINQTISAETAESLAIEYGFELRIKHRKSIQEQVEDRLARSAAGDLSSRPPVVTFMGHVDHGKTSLLDRIRSTRVVDGESGGITQHLGSYRYEKDGRVVTFLDTPGHEAFTQMRARGANMTDVAVLVVAADDGVMPQTVEAMNHAKAAGVTIVVALNKVDVPNANITRVMGQLAEHGLQPREWGGQTEVVQTSAATGQGIPELVEVLSLEAELLELKADPSSPARGVVIESEMDPGRGAVARLLVQDGTLKIGDVLLAGPGSGRVRQILDDRGNSVQQAGPSTPVEVSGLDELPVAGDKFYVMEDLAEAKGLAEEIRGEQRQGQLATKQQVTLDNLFQQIAAGEVSELALIVKADMQGSVEVLAASLNKLTTEEVRVKILHAAVGGVGSGDVLLADAAGAIIVGFHVVTDAAARELAEKLGVEIRLYRVIYELIDEVRLAMEGLLAPEIKEEVLGHAEVREVFRITRVGAVAGCHVLDGTVVRNAKIRITRGGIVIEDERTLDSLKRFKDDARDVRAGMECGMKIAGYDDIKPGDVLEAYKNVEVARKL